MKTIELLIENTLKEEFKKYNWEVEYSFKIDYPFFYVNFPRVIIYFYYYWEYNCINCSFYDINDNRVVKNHYCLSSLLELNKVDVSDLYFEFSNVSLEAYIKQYVNFIHQNLMYLIKGQLKSFENYTSLKKL